MVCGSTLSPEPSCFEYRWENHPSAIRSTNWYWRALLGTQIVLFLLFMQAADEGAIDSFVMGLLLIKVFLESQLSAIVSLQKWQKGFEFRIFGLQFEQCFWWRAFCTDLRLCYKYRFFFSRWFLYSKWNQMWCIFVGLFQVIAWLLHRDVHLRATVQDISNHWWTNQQVDLRKYRFQAMLRTCGDCCWLVLFYYYYNVLYYHYYHCCCYIIIDYLSSLIVVLLLIIIILLLM